MTRNTDKTAFDADDPAEFFGAADQAEAARDGWLQGRYHSEDGATVARMLSFEAVTGANPFEVGARRAGERRAFQTRRRELDALLDLAPLRRRAFVSLSNGEMRRVLLARTLLKGARRLVLHDPLGGLDPERRDKILHLIDALRARGVTVTVKGDAARDRPPSFRRDARVASPPHPAKPGGTRLSRPRRTPRVLLDMKHVNVTFGRRVLFRDFAWTIRAGERWLLRGPNGSGKTTLLALISGDSPLSYACDITVCGQRRGAEGAVLADARRRIGCVSPERQIYGGGTTDAQLDAAFAARPALLLLDEPCFGLSAAAARRLTRRIAAWLDAHPRTAAVCVAHNASHVPPGFSRELVLPQRRASPRAAGDKDML